MTILFLSASLAAFADDTPMQSLDDLLTTFRSEFVAIRPGEGDFSAAFAMGGQEVTNAEPAVAVQFDYSFEIGIYEIPQNLYEAVMGNNPSRWKGARNSAEMMTWHDANDFCERVTQLLRERELIDNNQVVRLPSEAEWEYCCRAGTETAYSFGDDARAPSDARDSDDEENKATVLDAYGWHSGNAAGNDPPVGALAPNPWGLYDMHGYLSEFCLDDWHDSHEGAAVDGSARQSAEPTEDVVIRGGSWKDTYPDLRSRSRQSFGREEASDAVGFRCVIE